ncbi:hypothetical protein F4859DRAFT_243124 [Xylaria cf. heliscus]|nr:hypothetical protein F4859DRAFT_243124 [Xylaria cf. heliscus]
MFLSWKPSSEGGWETLTKLPVGFDPVTAKKTGLQACSNCRARKVKCIWVVGGCERCKSSGRECIYETTTASGTKGSRRKSKGASTGTSRDTGPAITALEDQAADATASPPAPGEARWAQKPSRPAGTVARGTSAATSAGASLPSHTSHDTTMSESSSTPISQEATVTGESSRTHSLAGPEMDVDLMMPFMGSLGGADRVLLSSSATNSPGSILENHFADMGKRAVGVTPTHLDILAGVDPWETFDPWEANAWVPTPLHMSAVTVPTASSSTGPLTKPGGGGRAAKVPLHNDSDEDDEDDDDDDEAAPCWCLRRLVVLVDEIESIVDGHGLMSLDGAMAAHKEALGRGAAMLQCTACTGRVENMMILALLVDKLVRVCRRVGEACATGLTSGESSKGTSSSSSSNSSDYRLILRSRSGGVPDTPVPPGRHGADGRVYSVDAPDEYLFVVAGLLRFQLLQLFDLTQQLRLVAACAASGPMSRRLSVCSKALRDMLREAELTPTEQSDAPLI